VRGSGTKGGLGKEISGEVGKKGNKGKRIWERKRCQEKKTSKPSELEGNGQLSKSKSKEAQQNQEDAANAGYRKRLAGGQRERWFARRTQGGGVRS